MATEHKENTGPKTSSESENFPEKVASPSSDEQLKEEKELDNLQYPEPWKFEKFFIGGYSQGRMLKFKNPKTMYRAINLFA
ncbi:MAG: hypothetical protein Q9174_007220, partial [Haloplaca sp. 1 TL-2023]